MPTYSSTILSVQTSNGTFAVGDSVLVSMDHPETYKDGLPVPAKIAKIDWDKTAKLEFVDGDEGWYGLDDLTKPS